MAKQNAAGKQQSNSDVDAVAVRDRADTLYRAALECCRQRDRHARAVDNRVSDEEQRATLKLATFCDELLIDAANAYEKSAAHEQGFGDSEWWHRANSLWHASREYERRHRCCESTSHKREHNSASLGALALDYDLEASALLMLQQACAAYKGARPEAELKKS